MVHVKVGVLALQGSFREHCVCLTKAGATAVEVRSGGGSGSVHSQKCLMPPSAPSLQVRKPEQLHDLRGLIIPGGESTTMALVAERWGLVRAPLP
jgi:5'-phosphate synthase pdxT subunit